MVPLTALYFQAALMVLVPIALWVIAVRRSRLGRTAWALIGYGCLFFLVGVVLSAVLGLGLFVLGANAGPVQAVAAALVGALGQEGARFLAMRRVGQVREALDRRGAVVFGLGQGGFHVLILGLVQIALARIVDTSADPSTWAQLPEAMQRQVSTIAETAPHVFLLGAVGSLLGIALHAGLSLVVMRAVLTANAGPLVVAVGWRWAADAVGQLLQSAVGNPVLTLTWVALAGFGALLYGVKASAREESDGATPSAGERPFAAAEPAEAPGSGARS